MGLSLFIRKIIFKLSPKSDLSFPRINMDLNIYEVKGPRNVSITYIFYPVYILFLKEFLACKAALSYLPKSKRDLGLACGANFLRDFSIKCFLFDTLSMDKVSMSYVFFVSRCQTKYVVKVLFRQLMTS